MKSLLLNLVLIDGRGAPPVPGAWLVVEDDRILDSHAGALPPGRFDATIDFQRRTCLPGLHEPRPVGVPGAGRRSFRGRERRVAGAAALSPDRRASAARPRSRGGRGPAIPIPGGPVPCSSIC
jgi:hypothetical protein